MARKNERPSETLRRNLEATAAEGRLASQPHMGQTPKQEDLRPDRRGRQRDPNAPRKESSNSDPRGNRAYRRSQGIYSRIM